METAGYSGTPLAKKLGIKEGFNIRIVNAPDYYFNLFSDFPKAIKMLNDPETKKNFIHYFTKEAAELEQDIQSLRKEIYPDGMIWISWPKKASKITTDLSDQIVRELALANGLVDIKVCAVDTIWSGLKFVIPVKDRVGRK
jgi:hypothetical protein